jgi:hypothetical protein
VPVYSLSFHANYACRHSGACCTAGWTIPVEPRLLPLLGVDVLVPKPDGACAHFDAESRLCTVQCDHGESMLPGSCYQFPRRALIDERGTFIALSNFCPTAAALMCERDPSFGIVRSPAAFPECRIYEGLDARGHWPPLVRPGVLFDLNSYSLWEQFIVSTLASGDPVDTALARIAGAAETLRTWMPDRGPFEKWATHALHQPVTDPTALDRYQRFRTIEAYDTLRGFVPEGWTPPQSTPSDSVALALGGNGNQATACRYLASKAFASWSAYEGRGIRTLVAELLVSELVLRVECDRASRGAGRPPFGYRSGGPEQGRGSLDRALMIDAIRQSDLLLVHLIDRTRMIKWLGQVEAIY